MSFKQLSPARATALDPEAVQLYGVDPKLARIRWILATIFILPFVVLVVVLAFWLTKWLYIPATIFGLFYLWVMWLIPRQVRNYAWGITEDEIHVRKGAVFWGLETMPLGRVQYAKHSEGPLARHYGLSEVTITCAASSDLKIVGLPEATARELTGLLIKRAGADLAGL